MGSDADVEFTEKASACCPCIYNKDFALSSATKITEIKMKLQDELEVDDDCEEEIIAKLNLYAWVEFQLGNIKGAKELNEKALKQTDWKNITSVLSQAYILLKDGYEIDAHNCLDEVERLKKGIEGEKLLTEAKAELAYSYSRLGGTENLSRAIETYTDVVKSQPKRYAWKYRLGLAHRRATHGNISTAIPSKLQVIEHKRKAAELLFEVANNSSLNYLRGRAFSQLAVMLSQDDRSLGKTDCDEIFKGMSLQSLTDDALKCGSTDAKTLEECGRSLLYTDIGKAAKLLKKSLAIKKHSIAYHHLGLCYEWKAKRLEPSDRHTSFNDHRNNECSRIPKIPLNNSEPLVANAIKCYRKAIKISCDNNNPARYNLGLILRDCGDFESALSEFNKIIRDNLKSDAPGNKVMKGTRNYQYLLTVTCAYEEAGLCLLDLAKQPGKTEKEIEIFNKDAEEKLIQAVRLATSLNLCSEIDILGQPTWIAFETLENMYEGRKDSPKVITKYIDLLILVSNYEKALQVIEDLRLLSPEYLADSEVIKSGLESYLGLKKYEAAYTFLCVSITSPFFKKDDCKLESVSLKVCLYTAAGRLQAAEGNAKDILRPLFDQYIEKGNGDSNGGNQRTALDVLICYDTNVEETSVDLEQMAEKLQQIFTNDFYLSVSRIDEVVVGGRLPFKDQVEEISKARLVLTILSNEPHSSLFVTVLEYIPTTLMDCRDNSKPKPVILLGSANDGVEVPKLLKPYKHIPLWNLLDRALVLSEQEEDNDRSQPNEIQDFPETSSDNTRLSPSPANATSIDTSKDVGHASRLSPTPANATSIDTSKDVGHDSRLSPTPANATSFDTSKDVGHDSRLSPTPANATSKREKSQSSVGEFDDWVVAKMSLFCALINKEWPPESL